MVLARNDQLAPVSEDTAEQLREAPTVSVAQPQPTTGNIVPALDKDNVTVNDTPVRRSIRISKKPDFYGSPVAH